MLPRVTGHIRRARMEEGMRRFASTIALGLVLGLVAPQAAEAGTHPGAGCQRAVRGTCVEVRFSLLNGFDDPAPPTTSTRSACSRWDPSGPGTS
jgi:hypothetical protein